MSTGFSRRALLTAGAAAAGRRLLADDISYSRIPAGEYLMGSASGREDQRPPHRVRITRAFDMGKFEVTQSQWKDVMTDPHGRSLQAPHQGEDISDTPSQFKGSDLPVDSVSWYDVQLFLARLSARDERHGYRLPTEAEWEYACKSGRQQAPKDSGWFKDNSAETTHAVGQTPANPWGLHDMLGNVGEWVQDWYAADYYEGSPRTDPPGPSAGSYRVFRGGSWLDSAADGPEARAFEFPNSRL
jgi:formylglycine-generating enzyme required for sulfatase activity